MSDLRRLFKPFIITVITLALSGYTAFYVEPSNSMGQKEWFYSIVIYFIIFYNILNGKHEEKEKTGFIYFIYGLSAFILSFQIWALFEINLGVWVMLEVPFFVGFLVFIIYKFFDKKNKEIFGNLHIAYLLIKDYLKTLFSR